MRKLLVKARSVESVQKFDEALKNSKFSTDREWKIEVELNSNEILRKCDLIHTVTYARKPVLDELLVKKNFLHITCVGADTPGKQELERIKIVLKVLE